MSRISLFLDTRRADKEGRYPLKIRLSYQRHKKQVQKYVPTGLRIFEEEWDGKKVIGRFAKTYNPLLSHKVAELTLACATDKNTPISLSKKSPSFFRIARQYQAERSNGTSAIIDNTLSAVKRFSPSEELRIDQITEPWLMDFEAFRRKEGVSVNTISINLRDIRTLYNYAIAKGYAEYEKYPFRRFRIKKEPSRKRALSVEQLINLRDYPVEPHQARYRDMFMLSFYLMGINIGDLLRAGKPENGRLHYRRAKTKKLYDILITPEAQNIIDRYAGKEKLLDITTDSRHFIHRMNLELQRIGTVNRSGRGGKKIRNPLFPGLTSYWARHSWATIAASMDIPIDVIGRALGHSDGAHSTTWIYVDFEQQKIDDACLKVSSYVGLL